VAPRGAGGEVGVTNAAAVRLRRADAMFDYEEGRLPEAEALLSELIDEIDSARVPQLNGELCQCLYDRANVRRLANRWREALDDLARCEALAGALGAFARSGFLLNVYNLRAKLLSAPDAPVYDYENALRALAETRRLGLAEWIADELESDIAFKSGDWGRAAHAAGKAAQALAAEGWQRPAMSCRLRAGRAYVELGDLARSRAEITPALQFFERLGPPDQLAAAQLAEARLQSAEGRHDGAWEMANRALEGVEGLIRNFRALFEQQRFVLDKLDYYDQAFAVGWARGGRQGRLRAWTVAERAKSFYLCSLVANADVRLFDGVDPDQIDLLKNLEAQLDDCEREHGRLSGAGADLERLSELEDRRRQLSASRRELLEKLMRANPRWAALRTPPPFDLEEALRQLDPAWVPVSYYWRSEADRATLHTFYAGPEREPRCVQTRWSAEQLSQLEQSRERLRGVVSPRTPLFPDELIPQVFPPPLCELFESGPRLLISPHDHLRAVPLHALPWRDGERLIGRCPVQYIPTLALLPLRKRVARPEGVLLMGCEQDDFNDKPLREVPVEIEALGRLWSARRPGRVTRRHVLQGDTPDSVGLPPTNWEDFEFVHIACHGVFSEERPLDAALRLGKDALRASEFFDTRLNAALVSLSACALGRQTSREPDVNFRGNEWVGLYLPLLYAGAQAMLVSLWDANSQTAALFMETLHTALSEGASPAEAFQQANRGVSSKPAPLWANWYLVGVPDLRS
jgi:CHAT domain-containing protein